MQNKRFDGDDGDAERMQSGVFMELLKACNQAF
jgi:hypothetical protein